MIEKRLFLGQWGHHFAPVMSKPSPVSTTHSTYQLTNPHQQRGGVFAFMFLILLIVGMVVLVLSN